MSGKKCGHSCADYFLPCRPSHCCRPRCFPQVSRTNTSFQDQCNFLKHTQCFCSQGSAPTKSRRAYLQSSKFADKRNRCYTSKIGHVSCSKGETLDQFCTARRSCCRSYNRQLGDLVIGHGSERSCRHAGKVSSIYCGHSRAGNARGPGHNNRRRRPGFRHRRRDSPAPARPNCSIAASCESHV